MTQPKILYMDLETIGVNALKSDLGLVACFGYMWEGDKDPECLTLAEYKGFDRKNHRFVDKYLLQAGQKIWDEADLVVAHYGSVFDRRFFEGRCVINGLKPPAPTKMRDTCMIARSRYNFSSNRLGHLAKTLGCPQRKSMSLWPDWWMRVLAGDKQALADMAEYCKQDVRTLRDVYHALLPYDQAHPRLHLDRNGCGSCGAPVQYRGFTFVNQHRYRRTQCTVCGKWDRERVRVA